MKKIISIVAVSSLLLASCWGAKTEDISKKTEKIPYNVSFITWEQLWNDFTIEKIGRISGAQEIVVNSQTFWKVDSVKFTEWDQVKAGQVIATLKDTVWNLGIRVEQATNSLKRAELSYENTKASMEKAVSDSKLALDQAYNKLELIKATNKNNLDLAESRLKSVDLDSQDSQASIDLMKMAENIEKMELDLDNQKQSNRDQIDSIISNARIEYITFRTTYSDVMEDLDLILGVTDNNKHLNNDIEDYLGARKDSTYVDAKVEFAEVKDKEDEYLFLDPSSIDNVESAKEVFTKVEKGYSDLIELLRLNDIMFKNSVETEWALASYIASVKAYEASVQGKYAKFITFKNSSNSFLNTYLTSEKSLILNIELQKKQYESMKLSYEKTDTDTEISYNQTISSNKDNLLSAEIAVENAKVAYENAKKSKDIALSQELNSISTAKLSLAESQKEYAKLFIKAPISGVVSNVYVDEGQEVSSSSKIFKVVSSGKQEIEISLPETELEFTKVWTEVNVLVNSKEIKGKIESISSVADDNLNYKATVSLSENVTFIGWTVKVVIPVKSEKLLLPISLVNTLDSNRGYIYVLTDESEIPSKKEVTLGKVWGDKIEILSEVLDTEKVVTTDMSNFDENKFKIVIK